jgi:hypothetical protein
MRTTRPASTSISSSACSGSSSNERAVSCGSSAGRTSGSSLCMACRNSSALTFTGSLSTALTLSTYSS